MLVLLHYTVRRIQQISNTIFQETSIFTEFSRHSFVQFPSWITLPSRYGSRYVIVRSTPQTRQMKYDETWVTNWLETRSRPYSTVHKSHKMRALMCQSERYIVALVRLLLRFLHLSSTGQTGSGERVGFLGTRAWDEEFYAGKRGRTHQCCVEWSKTVSSVLFRSKKISMIFKKKTLQIGNAQY